jgi:hypothetical protein
MMNIESITPERAQAMLDHNLDSNRRLRPHLVEKYASDMKRGMWKQTYDPVRLLSDGTLVDGQHRLSAIIATGISQKMLVVRVEEDVIGSLDQNAPRNLADQRSIQGRPRVMANVARAVLLCDSELNPLRISMRTIADKSATLDAHPEDVALADKWMRLNVHPRAAHMAAALEVTHRRGSDADDFFTAVFDNVHSVRGVDVPFAPNFCLYLAEDRVMSMTRKTSGGTVREVDDIVRTLRAWVFWRDHNRTTKVPQGGLHSDIGPLMARI